MSLDWNSGDDGHSHSIVLVQSLPDRILDICVWFDELMICDPEGNVISLESFIADGKRWWDAFHEGDERTEGFGMTPLKGSSE